MLSALLVSMGNRIGRSDYSKTNPVSRTRCLDYFDEQVIVIWPKISEKSRPTRQETNWLDPLVLKTVGKMPCMLLL